MKTIKITITTEHDVDLHIKEKRNEFTEKEKGLERLAKAVIEYEEEEKETA